MDPVSNPFSPGAGNPPPELAGRSELLEQARITLGRVKAGRFEQSLMLVGLRGVGKTVLLNRIRDLAVADGYYTAGEAGIAALDADSRLAVRAAARIYHAIGTRIRRRGCEVLDERARVSTLGKLGIFARAMLIPAGGSRPMQLDDSAQRALAAAERLLAESGISVQG